MMSLVYGSLFSSFMAFKVYQPSLSPGDGCVSLLRQQHCSVLSAQGGGNQISVFKHSSSGDPALDGVSLHPAPTPVHSGVTERPRGLPLSSSPTSLIPNGPFTRRFFDLLSRLWPVQIDLFATSANRQCCVFFSPFRDPLVAGTDAFLQCWDGLQAYAFPPWSILPKVLAKLHVSPGLERTLIAPYWPQRPWFADLLHLSLAPPVALSLRRDLLRLPQSHCLYQSLPRLRLHAWRLSGASLGLQVSPPL